VIHEANTTQWKVGDIVVHDMDSKDHKMLMVVLNVDDQAMAKSKYINVREIVPTCLIRKYGKLERIPDRILKEYEEVYENDKKYLHDPARFGIEITENDRINAKAFVAGFKPKK
jgi:hypothetical protein